MGKDNVQKLPVVFSVEEDFETEDSRFQKIVIDVLHTGLNFNGSIFKKEVVDKCAESIKNTPVLGCIAFNPNAEEYDFQGHEEKFVETEDGMACVYLGKAYGVIPESCNYRWITKECSDGVEREFFQVDAVLWNKFSDAVSIFNESGGKPHSMELEISSIEFEELEDGTSEITNFKFDGCCLLSSTDETIQPAMIDSLAVPNYSIKTIASEIKNMIEQYYTAVDTAHKEREMEKEKNFTLTDNQLRDEIMAKLDEYKYEDKWGYECRKYWFVDIQENGVIVEDAEDHYRLFEIPFTVEGDVVSLDYESAKRKKVQFVDFEDGEEQESIVYEVVKDVEAKIEEKLNIAQNEVDETKTALEKVENELNEIKPKYEEYVKAEEEREYESIKKQKMEEFEKFDAFLSNNEEYISLKNDYEKYSLEEIKGKCSIIYTEESLTKANSAKKNKEEIVAGVVDEKPAVEFTSRYGVMKTK